jgi:hypothetical protein
MAQSSWFQTVLGLGVAIAVSAVLGLMFAPAAPISSVPRDGVVLAAQLVPVARSEDLATVIMPADTDADPSSTEAPADPDDPGVASETSPTGRSADERPLPAVEEPALLPERSLGSTPARPPDADREASKQPEKPDKADKREEPEKPDKPDKREKPEKPDKGEKPEKPDKPDEREKPEKPEKPDKPEKPEKPAG